VRGRVRSRQLRGSRSRSFPGKKAFINETFEVVRSNLKALIADAAQLSQQGRGRGQARPRAPTPSRHQGDFRKIVARRQRHARRGHRAAQRGRELRGSHREAATSRSKITDSYNGDFNGIKNNLNTCIDALSGLIGADEPHVQRSTTRARSTCKHATTASSRAPTGRWRSGVNEMVFGHIAVKKKAMACLGEFGRGNFEAPAGAFPRQEGVHQRDDGGQVRTGT
jgi:methyl-accepting chemotaxis protein